VTEYAGPTPPRGTHRYIFLLYEQVPLRAAPELHNSQVTLIEVEPATDSASTKTAACIT
jgi:phosphatidylethanolamine-binding protein (PEBP) family uncharacterized protein